jgi:hypothetical protein
MINKFEFKKLYQDEAWLTENYVTLQKSSKEMAKSLHVSYKLVEIWLRHYGITIRQAV